MKSIVIHAPKDLRVEDHPEASPGPGQIRIRIKAPSEQVDSSMVAIAVAESFMADQESSSS